MKDGTELTHYGVKGMKWGKKLFGKVKGVFGKPSTYDRENDKYRIAKFQGIRDKKRATANDLYNKGRISAANRDNRQSQAWNVSRVQESKRFAQLAKKEGRSGADDIKDAHYYANKTKRQSKRINGR